MKNIDIIEYSLHTLFKRKKRTIMAMMGIIIAIGTLVSISSLINGFETQLSSQFNTSFEMNIIRLYPQTQLNPLQNEDVTQLQLHIPKIKLAFGLVMQSVVIVDRYNASNNIMTQVTCVNFERYNLIFPEFQADSGRIPRSNETEQGIVIGSAIANDKEFNFSVGSEIIIAVSLFNPETNTTGYSHFFLNVSAILNNVSKSPYPDEPSNDHIYVSNRVIRDLTDYLDEIMIIAEDNARSTIDNITDSLSFKFPQKFDTQYALDSIENINRIFEILSIFLQSIASISMIVAGFGIFNTMNMIVGERSREVGILKCVGARNHNILSIFICDSIWLGLFGSLIGIGFGYALAYAVSYFLNIFVGRYSLVIGDMRLKSETLAIVPSISLDYVLVMILVGIGITILFGLYPARKASKLKSIKTIFD